MDEADDPCRIRCHWFYSVINRRSFYFAADEEPIVAHFDELAECLFEASTPFVYIPEFSGIAYKHIWNVLPNSVSFMTHHFDRTLRFILGKSSKNPLGLISLIEPLKISKRVTVSSYLHKGRVFDSLN